MWCVSNKHAFGVRTVALESCDRTRGLGRGLCAKGHDSWSGDSWEHFEEVCTGHSLVSTHMTILWMWNKFQVRPLRRLSFGFHQ